MIKRLLIAATILAGSVYHSQAANITYKYWFDQNDSEMVTVNGSESLNFNINVSGLVEGLHRIHVYAEDGNGVSSVSTAYFMIMPADIELSNVNCAYAFDNEPFLINNGTFSDGTFNFELDATKLSESMHTVTFALIDVKTGTLSRLVTEKFMKKPITQTTEPGDSNGDGKISITDITYIVDAMMENAAADFDRDAADVNGDGQITVSDISAIVDIIMNNSK